MGGSNHSKNKKLRFGKCFTYFGRETKTGVVRTVFWLFFQIDTYSAISLKMSQ